MSFKTHSSPCCYGWRILFWSRCRMWTKPLKRDQGKYLIFKKPILVPPSRQRWTALAFPLSHRLGVRWLGRPEITLCSVKLRKPDHPPVSESLIEVDRGLIFGEDWEFKRYTHLLQNKEIKISATFKKTTIAFCYFGKKKIFCLISNKIIQFLVPWNVTFWVTLTVVDVDLN